MKKEFSIADRPPGVSDEYLTACGNFSWFDFAAGMPSPVFLVTGWKSNGKENACLQSWACFTGGGPDMPVYILGKVHTDGHMYRSLKETGVCVLNFPSRDIYDRCIRTIGRNEWETDEITAAGLTAERASAVDAPRIPECFLNIECEYLWEHELCPGSREVTVALRGVHLCMDEAHYAPDGPGRYGKTGYLFQMDQPMNPETGVITSVGPGVLEETDPIPWITR